MTSSAAARTTSTPTDKGLENTIVDFLQGLRFGSIPAQTLEHVKQNFLDTLGSALAGTAAKASADTVTPISSRFRIVVLPAPGVAVRFRALVWFIGPGRTR